MNKRQLFALASFVCFLGWRAFHAPAIPAPSVASAEARPVAEVQKVAANEPAAVSSQAHRGSSTMTKFAYPKELSTYVFLHQKIFLTDAEKSQRTELLRHADLLRALGARLREPTRSMEVMNEQDTAIDLLIEALRTGDKTVAAEVLREVVRDGQVENASLARPAREQLAGLKAEVLYQWSAVSPEADVASLLPGPVSQKIWANVVRMQESNRAESMAASERDSASARGGYGLRDENDTGH